MSVEETPIHCLPDEILEKVFSYLIREDRKSVSTVCRRWVPLALQWSTIQLNVDFRQESDFRYHALQESRRPYKHLQFYLGEGATDQDRLLDIVAKLASSMQSLKLQLADVEPYDLSFLAGILRLSGNLKELCITGGRFRNNYVTMFTDRPMENLNRLYMNVVDVPRVPVQDISPNVTTLHIRIDSGSIESLSILDHFCLRLTELEVWCYGKDSVLSVCALDFPKLQKLTFFCDDPVQHKAAVEKSKRFFQMCPLLQEASLTGDHFKQALGSLSKCSVNLHYLHLHIKIATKQSFTSINSMESLKTLKIQGAKIKAPAITEPSPCKSLESLILDHVTTPDNSDFNYFLCEAYPALRTIELINVGPDGFYKPTYYFSEILPNLECLEQITLDSGTVDMMQFLLYVERSLPKLREITFKYKKEVVERVSMEKVNSKVQTLIVEPGCDLVDCADYLFDEIKSLYPNLKKLTVTELNESALKDIQKARKQMPGCEIIVERLLPSKKAVKKSS